MRFALKDWAVTIEALAQGEQVLIVRKGGIGEKTFALPHDRFFLFPTHLHQRPDLVTDEGRALFSETLARREEPDELPLPAIAEIHGSFPLSDPGELAALRGLHILSEEYATERLRWRPKHPLWAVVLRVHRLTLPPTIALTPELGGCVSWVDLGRDLPEAPAEAALDDVAFAEAADLVEERLSAARTG